MAQRHVTPNLYLCIRGAEHQHTIFNLGWARCEPTRSAPGHVTLNMCFCILCDLEVTLCVLVHPGRETSLHYFHVLVGPCGSHRKRTGTHYVELMFLHPVRSVGHVMRSGASGCEMSMHYFSFSGGPSVGPTRSTSEHVIVNLYFCIPSDLGVT
jgi:hypothetical protein